MLAGLAAPTIALVGLGAVLVFVATGMLVPVVARPLSSALGRPLASLLGTPGKAGARELDAQPAPDRADRRGAHDRAGARVDDRRPRRFAQHFGQGQRRQRGQRRLHRHRLGRFQQIRGARGLAAAGSHHGDHDLPGSVRVQGGTVDARRRDTRRSLKDGHAPRHGRQRSARDGRGAAADRHHDRERGRPPRRFGGAGQVRPDRCLDDDDRRDLQAEPARRQLRRRRWFLHDALRQSSPDRRAAEHCSRRSRPRARP